MKKMTALRLAAAVAGGALLFSVASLAMADELVDTDGVEITVEIQELPDAALTMTVAPGGVELAEVTSADASLREFTGQLPTVTVTDSRDPATLSNEVAWAVVGTVADFEGDADQKDIEAGHLGWTPRLLEAGETGSVMQGEAVPTVMDPQFDPDDVGLVDQELLAMAWDSLSVRENDVDQWTATADLVLKVASDIDPGTYTSILTLSLFE